MSGVRFRPEKFPFAFFVTFLVNGGFVSKFNLGPNFFK